MDEAAASRLIKKAVAYGVQFTPEEIYDLSGCCNQEAMNVLWTLRNATLSQELLEDLWVLWMTRFWSESLHETV